MYCTDHLDPDPTAYLERHGYTVDTSFSRERLASRFRRDDDVGVRLQVDLSVKLVVLLQTYFAIGSQLAFHQQERAGRSAHQVPSIRSRNRVSSTDGCHGMRSSGQPDLVLRDGWYGTVLPSGGVECLQAQVGCVIDYSKEKGWFYCDVRHDW